MGRQQVLPAARRWARVEVDEHAAAHGTLHMTGEATSELGTVSAGELLWQSSLQGFLGRGRELVVDGPIAGEHVITLIAPDGRGHFTRCSRKVRIPSAVE